MSKKLKFGKAFPEEFNRVSGKFNHFNLGKGKAGKDWQEYLMTGSLSEQTLLLNPWRRIIFVIILMIAFSIILLRLVHLQVVEGKTNRELADSNRIKVKVIHAPRGVIYDRNGKILAQNEPGFRLEDKNATSSAKARVITREEAIKMEVNSDPNFGNLEIDSIRSYPQGEKTAHILGYTSEITQEELEDVDFKDYKLGDKVGRGGVEQNYEKILRGIDGGEIIEVDASLKPIRTLRKTEAIPGQNLVLTIDSDLQGVSHQALEKGLQESKSCCGAVVVQDPNTGEILSLVSIPSFNPKDISSFLNQANFPLLNRAIAGTYPPGSTYKIASSLAGLSSGKITADTRYEDTGVLELGPYKFANWYFTQYGRREEGLVDVVKALQRSNDIFFYRLGQETGEEIIGDYSKKLGLGKKLGIDIPGEEEGLIPNNDWKVKNIGDVWYPGDTLHMSIGQGFVLTTPLQIAYLTSVVASNGKQFPPHLALEITDPKAKFNEGVIKHFNYDPVPVKNIRQQDLELVKRGLEEVPKTGGTAWPFFNFPFTTAGKTGTAEFGDGKKTHAWYTAYAPVEEPKVVVTVLLEGGGEGSTNASPVAKEILRWFLSTDKNNLLKDIGQVATDSARTLGE